MELFIAELLNCRDNCRDERRDAAANVLWIGHEPVKNSHVFPVTSEYIGSTKAKPASSAYDHIVATYTSPPSAADITALRDFSRSYLNTRGTLTLICPNPLPDVLEGSVVAGYTRPLPASRQEIEQKFAGSFAHLAAYYSLARPDESGTVVADSAEHFFLLPWSYQALKSGEHEPPFADPAAVNRYARNNNDLTHALAPTLIVHAAHSHAKAKTLYVKPSVGRRPDYQIYTAISAAGDTNAKLEVTKVAATPEARPHIAQLPATYKRLTKLPRPGKTSSFEIVPVTVDESSSRARFPFVDGSSLYDLLDEALLNDDWDSCAQHLQRFIALVGSLPSASLNPLEQAGYSEVFGTRYDTIVGCTTPGLIDLNFDNIVINSNDEAVLIDYEWSFPFAVPTQFLVLRAVYYFFAAEQYVLRQKAARGLAVRPLTRDIHLPSKLFDTLRPYTDRLDAFLASEAAFQHYVTGKHLQADDADVSKSGAAYQPVQLRSERLTQAEDELQQVMHELEATRQSYAKLQKEQQAILASKSWQLARRLARLRHLFERAG